MDDAGQTDAQRPLAQLLVQYRRAVGWTQEDLAAESGLSHRTISDMERGVSRRPQHRTLRALADALELSDAELRQFLEAGGERLVPAPRAPAEDPGAATEPAPDSTPQPPPNTLPPESANLTGRDAEIRIACGLVRREQPDRNRTRVICVHGSPGIGKTSFALHCAHRLAPSYRDGAFFVDLRGMDAEPLPVVQALGQVLTALGVSQPALPSGTDERAGLLRTLLADQQVLLLLDNVSDEAQLRPLIPAAPGSLVLATSRRTLAGLTDAERVFLGVLDGDASARLLGDIAGRDRVAAEPAAAARVAELCGGLPLALRIAGNRLATRPGWAIANLVAVLAGERRRLTALTAGDLQVRSAFAMSYRQCSASERTMFRRLSLISGADFPATLAAVVCDVDTADAAATLEGLVDASLLQPGSAADRYSLHDLLRVFAGERLHLEEPPRTASTVAERMHAWLLTEGARQGRIMFPPWPDVHATYWLDTEKTHWRSAVHAGSPADVVEFCLAMQWYFMARPDRELWPDIFAAGVAAARTLDRPADLAMLLNMRVYAEALAGAPHEQVLGSHEEARRLVRESGGPDAQAWAVYYRARLDLIYRRPEDAADHARHARTLFTEAGDRTGELVACSSLGLALYDLGRYADAAVVQRRALDMFDPDLINMSVTRLRLGAALEALGETVAAQAEYRQVKNTFPRMLGMAAAGLGRCAAVLGDRPAARQHFEQALGVFAGAHELWGKATTLASLAELDADEAPERAARYREHALRLCADVDTPDAAELAARLTGPMGRGTEDPAGHHEPAHTGEQLDNLETG